MLPVLRPPPSFLTKYPLCLFLNLIIFLGASIVIAQIRVGIFFLPVLILVFVLVRDLYPGHSQRVKDWDCDRE